MVWHQSERKMKLFILFSLCSVAFGDIVPRLDGKIVGGEAARIEEFPYQVSVRIYDQHICGGSIIDETTIVTAAHCVYGMDHSQFSVRVGNTYHDRGNSYSVYRVKQHGQYDPDTTDYDIAILKINGYLRFDSTTKPIKLAIFKSYSGSKATVSGWGVTYEGSQQVSAGLRKVDVDVISTSDCIKHYTPGQITARMMCAQTTGKDSCQGDSGGPLASDGQLIGIVSWGYGCARPQFPGVYSSVASLYGWIAINKY